MKKIFILDSTLRDGAQSKGISFSLQDKIKITHILDKIGVDYIEAGNPFSNPKDIEFFHLLKEQPLKYAKLTAFGSTRRKNIKASDDLALKSLIAAGTECVTIFGKTWDLHVTEILCTTLEENLNMISDTITYLKSNNLEVIFDAEHFFDGYKENSVYAIKALKTAVDSGADCLTLCDTCGGTFPNEIEAITKVVVDTFPQVSVGIHAHNDGGMDVANSISAVLAGANHIQGTFTGFGERCGNANLSSIIPNLQLKKQYQCVFNESLAKFTAYAIEISEISNMKLNDGMPFVGANAFAHKAGMHVDGVQKISKGFEHIPPELVGNARIILLSEVGGRGVIAEKVSSFLPEITKQSPEAALIIEKVKELEMQGYQFEGAQASFELMVMRLLNRFKSNFVIEKMHIVNEYLADNDLKTAIAAVKVRVNNQTETTAAEGEGPVNALDKALRKALEVFYPEIATIKLVDYKVRVIDSSNATAAKVRVLIESSDNKDYWTTVGVSGDVVKASCVALIDSIEYKLLNESRRVQCKN